MSNMARTYIVIDTNDITQDMIDESIHHGDTFLKSLDESQAVLKFATEYPNTMAGYQKRNGAEIEAYLITNTADWTA